MTFFWSCKPEDSLEINHTLTPEEISFFSSAGLNTCHGLQVGEDYVVLENDIYFDRNELKQIIRNHANEEKLSQTGSASERQNAVNTALIAPIGSTTLAVFIDPAFSAEWQTSINTAITEWNAINECRVTLTVTTNHNSAGISILSNGVTITNPNSPAGWATPLGGGIGGEACFSTGTAPGRFIRLNDDVAGFTGAANNRRRVNTTKHEIGHTFGYRHALTGEPNGNGTDACGTAVTGNVALHGTPASDGTSVMRQGFKEDLAFSAGDIRASQLIYPNNLNAPTSVWISNIVPVGFGGLKSFNINLNYPTTGAPYYNVRFVLSRSGGATYTFTQLATATSYNIAGLPAGNYTLTTRGLNYKNDFLGATNTITFTL